MQTKKRPTLEQLKEMPVELWRLEVAQIGVDAAQASLGLIESEAVALMGDSEISPEKVVALREKLKNAAGGTEAAKRMTEEPEK